MFAQTSLSCAAVSSEHAQSSLAPMARFLVAGHSHIDL